MKAFDRIREVFDRAIRPAAGAEDERLLEWLGIPGTPKKALGEVTYFTNSSNLS